MKSFNVSFCLLVALLFVVSSSFLSLETDLDETSGSGGWKQLGKQIVSPGADYDALEITEEEKTFKYLKFKVLKSPIYINTITIMYNDRTSERHIITRQFKKGQTSRVFNLVGHQRTIEKIIFNYKSRRSGRGQTELVVMAKD